MKTKPMCSVFGKCGGCSFQDIPYQEQLDRKKDILEKATGFSEIKVMHDEPYSYRNRMDMIFHESGIGFRKKGTWDTAVDVRNCPISNERLNHFITEVRKFFSEKPDYFNLKTKEGTLRYAVIRTPGKSSSVNFVLNSASPKKQEALDDVRRFASLTKAENVLASIVHPNTDVSFSDEYLVIKGDGNLKEEILGKEFSFPVQGFFQNNTVMAERMHKHVRGILKEWDRKVTTLVDMYSGVGVFGVINADLYDNVIAVEGDSELVRFASMNAAKNHVTKLIAQTLRDRDFRKLSLDGPVHMIADPPRAGLHPKAMKWLNSLKPDNIVYVSCNPRQLEKDIAGLKGYEIKSVALLDFFPQTPHIESIVELQSKDV